MQFSVDEGGKVEVVLAKGRFDRKVMSDNNGGIDNVSELSISGSINDDFVGTAGIVLTNASFMNIVLW